MPQCTEHSMAGVITKTWVKQSALFLILAVMFFAGLAVAFWHIGAMRIRWAPAQDWRVSRSGKGPSIADRAYRLR